MIIATGWRNQLLIFNIYDFLTHISFQHCMIFFQVNAYKYDGFHSKIYICIYILVEDGILSQNLLSKISHFSHICGNYERLQEPSRWISTQLEVFLSWAQIKCSLIGLFISYLISTLIALAKMHENRIWKSLIPTSCQVIGPDVERYKNFVCTQDIPRFWEGGHEILPRYLALLRNAQDTSLFHPKRGTKLA